MRIPPLIPTPAGIESLRLRAFRLAILFALLASAWACSPKLTMEQFELPKHAALLTASAFILILAPGRFSLFSSPAWPALTGFLVALGLAGALSSSPVVSFLGRADSLSGFLTWILYAFLFTCGTSLALRESRAIAFLIAIAAGGSALYAGFQQAGVDPFPGMSFRHVRSFAGNPDFLAQHMAMALPFLLTPALITGRTGWWAGAGLITLALGLTASRAGLLGGLAGAAALIWLARTGLKARPARLAGAAGVLVLSLGAAEFLLDPGYAIRTRAAALRAEEGLERARGLLWRGAAAAARARPLAGFGADTLGIVFPRFAPPRWASRAGLDVSPRHAHSDPLNVIVIGGIPALGAWIWLIVCAFRAFSHRQDPGDAPAAAALIACLIHNLFSFSTATTAPLFWLLLGILSRPARARPPAAGKFSSLALSLGLLAASLGAIRIAAGAYGFLGNEGLRHASSRPELAGFGAASRLAPWEITYLVRYGRALEKDGRLEEALVTYRRSVTLAPTGGLYLGNLARTRYALGIKRGSEAEQSEAFRSMILSIELAPSQPALYAAAIRAARELGREEEEERLLDRLEKVEPEWAEKIREALRER